jgi:RND family efflux transporter MFP subunit
MRSIVLTILAAALVAGCDSVEHRPPGRPAAEPPPGTTVFMVAETTITASFDAAGIAEPVEQARLSTRLMGNVTQVLAHEGDRVGKGQLLVRIDAREVEEKRSQAEAGIAEAEAVYRDALTQAERFRGLYADSAATRYQLDQAETGLARADAALRSARAARGAVEALGGYAEIRAPFAGIVTARHVDPGAFVAPGTPLVEVQDASRLRISVTVPPRVAATLKRGQRIPAEIEGRPVAATIEGLVPAPAGAVYTVNAVVPNPASTMLAGSAATLRIPDGTRKALLIPVSALVRQGDLIGVRVSTAGRAELRWVRMGTGYRVPSAAHEMPAVEAGARIEVLSGLRAGDTVLVGAD